MARLTVDDLTQALLPEGKRSRFSIFDQYCKQKPDAVAIPALRQALADEHHAVVKCAAHSLRKLGAEAGCAMDDLLMAAQKVDHSGMPQAYPECVSAMVAIDPNFPDLIPLITRFVGLDNWGPISASLKSLRVIGSPESLGLLRRIAAFWEPELNKTQRRVVAKLLEVGDGTESV